MKIVLKFGGTSVGNGKKIINVCEIVQKVKKNNQVIVISSALQSTTDELLELSEDAKKGQVNKKIIDDIVQRHQDTIKDIIQDKKIQDEVFKKISSLIKDLEKTVEGVIIVKDSAFIPMSLSLAEIIGTANRSPNEIILSLVLSLSSFTIITPSIVFSKSLIKLDIFSKTSS